MKKKPVASSSVSANEIIKKPIVTSGNKKKKTYVTATATATSTNKKPIARTKNVKQYMSSDSEVFYSADDSSFDTSSDGETVVEDPALSFIRMIYSDEESLDEEEAYALYQATQLFSSSSEEELESSFDSEDYDNDHDESSEDDSEGTGEFEYTVVEYVQPRKLGKKTEFIAYDSGSDSDTDADASNLLINTGADDSDSEHSDHSDTSGSQSDSEWMTYSVFDVDRDLALNQLSGCFSTLGTTSLCSQGSVTPDTLLFSTSSADKIPNIAPQVLAAISAAAKHMANQRGSSDTNTSSSSSSSSSKYFSYITLKDPLRAATAQINNEEEFLFFEEDAFDTEDNSDIDSISDDSEEIDISADDFESFSDCSSEDSDVAVNVHVHNPVNAIPAPTISKPCYSNSATPAYNNFALNRWNRVPIGAFRRSRRPSIPNYHHVHPSTALKSFSTDPANFTLVAGNGEDSFDESSVPTERSQSVVTWDELDLDIVPSANTSNTYHPVPKRSRSVAPATSNSLVNNFEWLNSNWNWEI